MGGALLGCLSLLSQEIPWAHLHTNECNMHQQAHELLILMCTLRTLSLKAAARSLQWPANNVWVYN